MDGTDTLIAPAGPWFVANMAWRRSTSLILARLGQQPATNLHQQQIRLLAIRGLASSTSTPSSQLTGLGAAGRHGGSGSARGIKAGDWAALVGAVAVG